MAQNGKVLLLHSVCVLYLPANRCFQVVTYGGGDHFNFFFVLPFFYREEELETVERVKKKTAPRRRLLLAGRVYASHTTDRVVVPIPPLARQQQL